MSHALEPEADPIEPHRVEYVTISVDGASVKGVRGQTLAGVMLGAGILSWRQTTRGDRPRGVFCGIGVCFDCVANVNGLSDVRLCQRRAREGDVVVFERVLPSEPRGER